MKIYHNARCSKSRQTLALIQDAGAEVEIVDYQKTPPNATELRGMLKALGMKPEAIVRKGEAIYKAEYKGKTLTDKEWIAAMVLHPILIERPIVVKDGKAVLGRPPENVNEFL